MLDRMKDPEFRHAYAEDQARLRVSFLVRALRESRNLSQRELAAMMSTTQSVVARIEDPDYGSLTVKTLLNVAKALDLPLYIDLPEWPDWLALMEDQTNEALQRDSFSYEACASVLDTTQVAVVAPTMMALSSTSPYLIHAEYQISTPASIIEDQPRQVSFKTARDNSYLFQTQAYHT